MASNTYNNNSVFNGTATFNNTTSLSDISANTVTSNTLTIRNAGIISGAGTINASNGNFNMGTMNYITANNSLYTPLISMNYSSMPSLSSNNIGYIYSTISSGYSGNVTVSGTNNDIIVYQITNVAIGTYILNLKIPINLLNEDCNIYPNYPGSSNTISVYQSSFNGNGYGSYHTIHGTWFITITSVGTVEGHLAVVPPQSVQAILAPSLGKLGEMKLIRIA